MLSRLKVVSECRQRESDVLSNEGQRFGFLDTVKQFCGYRKITKSFRVRLPKKMRVVYGDKVLDIVVVSLHVGD